MSALVLAESETIRNINAEPDRAALLRIRRAAPCYVLIDDDKNEARKHFRTTPLFSVREVKGLE